MFYRNLKVFLEFAKKYNDSFVIIFTYSVAHGLIFLNKGIFWDDWVVEFMNLDSLLNQFTQQGNTFIGYYLYYIFSLDNSIMIFRIITFSSYLVAALSLSKFLKSIKEVDATSRLIIVILFAIIPLNDARISIICNIYGICYGLFFLGLWLTSKYMISKSTQTRIIALLVLFASFMTQSLLVFYSIIISYIFFYEIRYNTPHYDLSRLCIRHFDFILLPLVFLSLKHIFQRPYGLYEDYCAITARGLILAVPLSITAFYTSFLQMIIRSITYLFHQNVLVLIILFIFAMLISISGNLYEFKKQPNANIIFMLGLVIFYIAAYPYLVVRHYLTFDDWNSRNQLLLPLGSSLILYFFIDIGARLKINKILKLLYISIILTLFLNSSILGYISFQEDWYKQVSLVENIKASEIIKNNSTILFEDQTHDLNANNRSYRFYEYSGMMRAAFGDESRLGCDSGSFQGVPYYTKYREYNLGAYSGSNLNTVTVAIDHGKLELGLKNLPELMYLEHFQHDRFIDLVRGAIRLSYWHGKSIMANA